MAKRFTDTGSIKLNILNWRKHNPKEVLKTPHWFRVSIDIVKSESLFGLSPATKWVWVCLLAEAMRRKTDEFELNIAWAAHTWNFKKNEILEAIESLNNNKLLRVDSESTPSPLRVDSGSTPSIREDKRREDKRILSPTVFDFESLYDKYPRKVGRTKGLQKLKQLVKSDLDFKKVSEAIDRFIKHHLRENTGPQFIPHFSTFVSSITDWYDEKAGSVQLQKSKPTYYPPPPPTDRHEPRTLKAQELRTLINSVVKPVDDSEPGPGAA